MILRTWPSSFARRGRQLRIATKYPRTVSRFLYGKGIYYFSLVQASGTLEAAPTAGYADLIADLASTRVTLRDNRLKTLEEGIILVSQACLIGNRRLLGISSRGLELARSMLEMMEGYIRASSFYRLTANVRGPSPEAVSATVLARPDLAGLQGPTISRVYDLEEEDWFAVSLVVPKEKLIGAVDHLRAAGGRDMSASQVSYLFKDACRAYQGLLDSLEEG